MRTDLLPSSVRRILKWRRELRLKRALGLVRTWPGMKVLDVGCGSDGRSFSDHCDPTWQITGIDLHPESEVDHNHPNFRYVRADARDLSQFRTKEFDLVVSFGMLEHITEPGDYQRTCDELQRTGKQYVVVVPFKWAVLEPHYGVPFFGAMPQPLQKLLIRAFNLSGQRHHMSYFESHYRWRSNAEYRRAFTGSRVRLMPTLDTIAIVSGVWK